MKKVIGILIIVSMFGMSCKKDYTCECKVSAEYDDNSGISGTITVEQSENIKDTKKKAEAKCEETESSLESDYSDATTKSITCTLK